MLHEPELMQPGIVVCICARKKNTYMHSVCTQCAWPNNHEPYDAILQKLPQRRHSKLPAAAHLTPYLLLPHGWFATEGVHAEEWYGSVSTISPRGIWIGV